MGRLDIEGDSQLLELLATASPAQVDPLVDYLTDNGRGRVTLPNAVKDLLLESKARKIYSRQALRLLIAELREFGGNSIANLPRQGGVSYREIAMNALSHLGGTQLESATVEQIELQFISERLRSVWATMSEHHRQAISTEVESQQGTPDLPGVQAMILKGGTVATVAARVLAENNLRDSVRTAADTASRIGKLAVARGLVLTLNDLAGTAYRVTIPCVTQIAYIRCLHRSLEHIICSNCSSQASSQGKFCIHCGAPLSSGSALFIDTTNGSDTELFQIGPSADKPLLTVSKTAELSLPQDARPLDAQSSINRLSALIQAMPSALLAQEVGSHRYLKCLVSGELSPTKDGTALRGFVKRPDGAFTEHARFLEDDRLGNLVNGAALFQIASVIVAQKHLADISRKLNDVLDGINRIERFQQNERKSVIDAAINYLREVASLVLEGDLNPNVHSELERFEVSLSTVQTHLRKDIDDLIVEVISLKNPDTFGTTGLTNALLLRQERFEDLVTQWKYCLAARFMACRLLACFPESMNVAVRRRDSLMGVSKSIDGMQGFIARFSEQIDKRQASFKALTDSAATVAANKERLCLWNLSRRPTLSEVEHVSFDSLDRLALDTGKPIELALEVQGGRVLRAFAI